MYRSTFSWPRHWLKVSGQLHTLSALSLRERFPGTHWLGCWVGPITGLDDVEKRKCLPPLRLELRSLGRPARSRSLYRLCYPGCMLLRNVGLAVTTQNAVVRATNPNCLRVRYDILLVQCTTHNAVIPFYKLTKNSVDLVRKRTIPTELPPHVGELSANFCG
jgi:hypothetical protein